LGASPRAGISRGPEFLAEAESALPWLDVAMVVNVEDVFQGLEVQRLRLHHDQQVPEWKERR
jgi:hypothetical protein